MLNAGSPRWGMSPRVAALAVRKYFNPSLIIPMHFGTFPLLAEEPEVRAAFARDRRLKILTPGEATRL